MSSFLPQCPVRRYPLNEIKWKTTKAEIHEISRVRDDRSGVTMADHHTESERFLLHVAREENAGRRCPAEWSWIVPPVSGGLTQVYHRYYDDPDPNLRPAFVPAPR